MDKSITMLREIRRTGRFPDSCGGSHASEEFLSNVNDLLLLYKMFDLAINNVKECSCCIHCKEEEQVERCSLRPNAFSSVALEICYNGHIEYFKKQALSETNKVDGVYE